MGHTPDDSCLEGRQPGDPPENSFPRSGDIPFGLEKSFLEPWETGDASENSLAQRGSAGLPFSVALRRMNRARSTPLTPSAPLSPVTFTPPRITVLAAAQTQWVHAIGSRPAADSVVRAPAGTSMPGGRGRVARTGGAIGSWLLGGGVSLVRAPVSVFAK